jgi:RimJ/RimL family protein N-acetyltransferase
MKQVAKPAVKKFREAGKAKALLACAQQDRAIVVGSIQMNLQSGTPGCGSERTDHQEPTVTSPDPSPHPLRRWLRGGKPRRRTVPVKELRERDRRRVLKHFLGLEKNDRLLRFGSMLSDELITHYVNKLDFSRDMVFGVYNHLFKLVGVGHLGFAPKEETPVKNAPTSKSRVAELGVSVSSSARGKGIGSRLFERAAIHCRNQDVDTLYMHCLSSNRIMMHIAKKAGMEIQRDYGEADAYLKLLPPDPGSVMQEALQEQFALLDYTFKANARAAAKWFGRLPGRGKRTPDSGPG